MPDRAWPPTDPSHPEVLAAWHGSFGHFDYWRKVILADSKLVARAKAESEGKKMTVDQLDDVAHTSDDYIAFLTDGLTGRVIYEQSIREQVGA